MSKPRRSSNASAIPDLPCRIRWRPSAWLGGALWTLALLAPCAVLASDLPASWAWPLALAAGLHGIVLARRHRRQPSMRWIIPPGRGQPTCDGMPMPGLRVSWRGPLGFVAWRGGNGRWCRHALGPDVLDAAGRRELKLALQRRESAATGGPMAG